MATHSYKTLPFTPSSSFPYTTSDLTPRDTSPDSTFYSSPRFVTHIDDRAISSLKKYYTAALPRTGRILDLCSSWISHYPDEVTSTEESGDLQVVGMGMNADELKRNPVLRDRWVVKDLNVDPTIGGWKGDLIEGETNMLDATTCVVSIDYLTRPLEVLKGILEKTRSGGSIHLAVSNRCFPTKAVRKWLELDESERLSMVGDYLWWSGWREIEVLVISDGGSAGWFQSGNDPLWIVRGIKE
jgi:hypothetical protein